MKQKIHSLLFLMSLIILTTLGMSSAPTQAQGLAPSALEKESISLRALKFLLHRFQTISIDQQIGDQRKNGVTTQEYIAGFSVSGAIIQHANFYGKNRNYRFNLTGGMSGIQLLPYRITILADGSSKITFSGLAFKNMNGHSNAYGAVNQDASPNQFSGWSVINHLSIMEVTLDRNVTFSNIQSYEINFADLELRGAIYYNRTRTVYLAYKGRFAPGLAHSIYTADDGKVDQIGEQGGSVQGPTQGEAVPPSFRFSYGAGLEFNADTRSGYRSNVQSNFIGSYGAGSILDPTITSQNLVIENQQTIAEAMYQQQLSNWFALKSNYQAGLPAGSPVIGDDAFTAATGQAKPVEPTATYLADRTRVIQEFGNVVTSGEFSKQLNIRNPNARPMRAGARLNWVVPVRNSIQGGNYNIDLNNAVRAHFQLRLFLNF